MGSRKQSDNRGYTLMELMIAAAALITITSVAVPSYNRYIASAREKVCTINRQTIMYDYNLYSINDPDTALSEYISRCYAEEEDHICPAGGVITADGSGDTASLTCSMHPDEITVTNLNAISEEFP